MWNHPIKRFATSTFVAGALLATALASHAQAASPKCTSGCVKQFRQATKMCGLEFSGCRIDPNGCGALTPGPDRAMCLAGCRSDRASCKDDALNNPDTGFKACKNTCP
jgi:hypothetical protein